MKHFLFVMLTLILMSVSSFAQDNIITLSGGYTFANPEGSEELATGFRINGLYEFNPSSSKVAHGLNLGYILNSYSETNQFTSVDFKFRTWALFYAPKLLLGNSDKFKFFIKGVLGMQFSKFSSEGAVADLDISDVGLYVGAGAGGMYYIQPNVFLNLEYEWAYLSNSLYNDGFMNTAQLGIGYRF
jgi:opacity protein-like surface antigen